VHGWPGSFLEMLPLADRLQRGPRPGGPGPSGPLVGEVVVPSLPGYGFSEPPTAQGAGFRAMAATLHTLMTDVLGHRRYAVHGTDVGATVAGWMAIRFPDAVVAVHSVEPYTPRPLLGPPADPLAPDEQAFLDAFARWQVDEGAYAHLQLTKPQTLAAALTDSPVGLAAWLAEKYRGWSDGGGDLTARYPFDDLLEIITLYWVTGTAASAAWSYRDALLYDRPVRPDERTAVPAGIAITTAATTSPPRTTPRRLVERVFADVRHWCELPRGGHFVSWEEPDLVADSIEALLRTTG
jgi:pimeloyl-ACP methyl ester carboxylesterase